ncbi:hypothetical protein SAMN04488118_10781 [Epibacterium ulvae]|uniref:Uncharacterized protein n=1 Tax=Epibacterium ulvae TaxID=1156985 RepID=A0A1G5R0N5_9RHOB|nr:hypothetical protein [Epibacterium ulvae]SCZ67592.1 hypothetical protein SAMN04488118_10781 [Epibacterium ulvae]
MSKPAHSFSPDPEQHGVLGEAMERLASPYVEVAHPVARLLAEIDETILPRRLSVRLKGASETEMFAMWVVQRRLVSMETWTQPDSLRQQFWDAAGQLGTERIIIKPTADKIPVSASSLTVAQLKSSSGEGVEDLKVLFETLQTFGRSWWVLDAAGELIEQNEHESDVDVLQAILADLASKTYAHETQCLLLPHGTDRCVLLLRMQHCTLLSVMPAAAQKLVLQEWQNYWQVGKELRRG